MRITTDLDASQGFNSTKDRIFTAAEVAEMCNRLKPPSQNAGKTAKGDWIVRCPIPHHADHDPSCHVGTGRNGGVLINCHSCNAPIADFCNALGIEPQQLASETSSSIAPVRPLRNEIYTYCAPEGQPMRRVIREYKNGKKSFRQETANGSGVSPAQLPHYPYRLPELIAAKQSETVFIVEGEKDVERIRSAGGVATCNCGGAGKGKWKEEWNKWFEGRKFIILPDNDQPGKEHAERISETISPVASSVDIIELPDLPPKGDVSDWLDAGGKIADILLMDNNLCGETFDDFNEIKVQYLVDGWLPCGMLALLGGPAGVGKTTISINLMSALVNGNGWMGNEGKKPVKVAYWSSENSYRAVVKPLLKAAGAKMNMIYRIGADPETLTDEKRVPFDLSNPLMIQKLKSDLRKRPGVKLVVLDPIVSIAAGVKNSFNNTEVRKALRPLEEMMAGNGVSVLGITHTAKRTGTSKSVLDSVIGSAVWGQVARVIWGADFLEDGEKALMIAKNNLGEDKGGRRYGVEKVDFDDGFHRTKIAWGDMMEDRATEVLVGEAAISKSKKKSDKLREAILAFLRDNPEGANGSVMVATVGEECSVSSSTVRNKVNQMKNLGEIVREGGNRNCKWKLATERNDQ